MNELTTESLSVLLIWTAISIYAVAFIMYVFDLARRSEVRADTQDAVRERSREFVGAGVGVIGGQTAPPDSSGTVRPVDPPQPRFIFARIATSLTALAFLFHLAGTILRGIAAERVPWANLYEFAMTGTLLMVAVYLGMLFKVDIRYIGSAIVGIVLLLLGGSAVSYYVIVSPLVDPLKSIWLVIHVFVASLATAFFALAFAVSVLQLMQHRRERLVAEGAEKSGPRFVATLPPSGRMESLAYNFTIVGFVFWTFTLIAGAIWAQDSWGRYWAFDVKETWTFIIWVLYAGYIHARSTRGWRGVPSAWLSIVGFAAVMFNFTAVNTLFKGLHAYSGLG